MDVFIFLAISWPVKQVSSRSSNALLAKVNISLLVAVTCVKAVDVLSVKV